MRHSSRFRGIPFEHNELAQTVLLKLFNIIPPYQGRKPLTVGLLSRAMLQGKQVFKKPLPILLLTSVGFLIIVIL